MINSNAQCGLDVVLGEVLKKNSSDIFKHSRAHPSLLVLRRASVLSLSWASDVVDLKDHLDYLCSQQDLLLFANKGLDHMLLLHV